MSQNYDPVLLRITTYYSSSTPYNKLLLRYYSLLLRYYSVLQSTRTTKYYSVLQSKTPDYYATKYYSVLHRTTKYYSVLRRITKYFCTTPYYEVRLPTTRCHSVLHRVLQSIAPYCKVLLYYSVLQSKTPYYKVLQSTSSYYKVQQSSTKYYKVLLHTTNRTTPRNLRFRSDSTCEISLQLQVGQKDALFRIAHLDLCCVFELWLFKSRFCFWISDESSTREETLVFGPFFQLSSCERGFVHTNLLGISWALQLGSILNSPRHDHSPWFCFDAITTWIQMSKHQGNAKGFQFFTDFSVWWVGSFKIVWHRLYVTKRAWPICQTTKVNWRICSKASCFQPFLQWNSDPMGEASQQSAQSFASAMAIRSHGLRRVLGEGMDDAGWIDWLITDAIYSVVVLD